MCPSHCCPLWLLLLVTVTLMPMVHPYGFRNCIEDVKAPLYFRCIQRFLQSPALAVSDLPPHAIALNLSYNKMRCLQPSAFAHLTQLHTLDLTYNLLETLSPGAFNGLGVLVVLDLSHNKLTTLAEGVFNSLGNLSSLQVQHNPLSTVSPSALLPLVNLRRLSLRGGRLNGLGAVAVAVQGLAQLELLDLCENNLGGHGDLKTWRHEGHERYEDMRGMVSQHRASGRWHSHWGQVPLPLLQNVTAVPTTYVSGDMK